MEKVFDSLSTDAASRASLPGPPSSTRPAWWKPSHQHTALSATLLLSAFALLSRVIGQVRETFIANTFGAGPATDAYNVAYQLPDLITSLLVGGAASIVFVTLLSRYRESGRDQEGDEALSVILSTIFLVLGGALLLAEFFVPAYSRWFFPDDPAQAALCTLMTRILLPGQLFFVAGGVLASVALVRKQFAYQAISPLVYTLGIILAGVLFAHSFGIASLAVGAVVGAFAGPYAINAYAARRLGVRFHFKLDFSNPGLHEWVRLSIPLMLGFTTVFLDSYILTWFAKHVHGDISRLNYAKRLFAAPIGIVGQAAGAASFPFFASLFSRQMFADFRTAVNRAISRILAVALMISAGMYALALPIVTLLYRHGRFSAADASSTAIYFAIFTLSLVFWAAQPFYARAFYAAGETRLPLLAGTLVMLASLPVYWLLHRAFGVVGLAWASNLAIAAQTITMAVLAHKRFLVPLYGISGGPEYREIANAFAAAAASLAGTELLLSLLPQPASQIDNLAVLLAGGLVWAAVCLLTLWVCRSKLLQQLRRR